MVIAGIDYGSRHAGTTCICFSRNGSLFVEQSEKKRDADDFLLNILSDILPSFVMIDAPLSLPSVYFGSGDDYFFRKGDRLLHAMSPMFLGGLTARAIRLKARLHARGMMLLETYPSAFVQRNGLGTYYRSDLSSFGKELAPFIELKAPGLSNWHQVDSVLAWCCAVKYCQGKAEAWGDDSEGIIYI